MLSNQKFLVTLRSLWQVSLAILFSHWSSYLKPHDLHPEPGSVRVRAKGWDQTSDTRTCLEITNVLRTGFLERCKNKIIAPIVEIRSSGSTIRAWSHGAKTQS